MAERTTFVFMLLAGGPVPAGRLRMIEDGRNSYAAFAYGARYRERPDAVPIDPEMLPLDGTTGEVLTDEGFELFNGIRDAAPDGWGRALMQRAAGAKTLGEYDFLVASGEHRVGALAFGPTAEKPERIAPWGSEQEYDGDEAIDLAALTEAAAQVKDIDRLDPRYRRLLAAGSSLGGARPKAATIHDGEPWIAKFSAANDRYDVPRAEYAAMTLATKCGLNVPPVDFITVLDRPIYLIKRFDRLEAGKRRLPFASALTLLRALEIAAGDYSYAEVAAAFRKHGSAPIEDLTELYRRMVFNILVGNSDDHLRNHGAVHDGREWRLSPLYDVVPLPQLGTERFLVLGIGEEGKRATLSNAASAHGAFGLDRAAAVALIRDLAGQVGAQWETTLKASGLSADDRERLQGCFAACAEPTDAL